MVMTMITRRNGINNASDINDNEMIVMKVVIMKVVMILMKILLKANVSNVILMCINDI